MTRRVIVLADPEAVARRAAEEIIAAASALGRGDEPFTIALSGGSTPKLLYRLLGAPAEPYRARLPWRRVHLFWGDERHVAPEHADSNYRMTREALLDGGPLAAEHVHRVLSEGSDAARVAEEYEKELRHFFRLTRGEAPRFDVALLGMGADGHTASLFPGSSALDEHERLVAATWVEKFKTHRITCTARVFNAAKRVLFLVAGADKAATLREVLEGPRDTARLPSQLIDPRPGDVTWLIDEPAAAELTRP